MIRSVLPAHVGSAAVVRGGGKPSVSAFLSPSEQSRAHDDGGEGEMGGGRWKTVNNGSGEELDHADCVSSRIHGGSKYLLPRRGGEATAVRTTATTQRSCRIGPISWRDRAKRNYSR
ncbi:hypothetical protein KC336_g9 [Hortaea werneckii]|nr:hypothetical protein KC336_g9 [Hortaea werneckii]